MHTEKKNKQKIMLDYILLYFNISGMHNEQQELGALVELFNNGSPPKKNDKLYYHSSYHV